MTVWDRAIEFVLREEGGYTNDPNDHGGETNFGISKRRYPDEDVKNMTKERATFLYQRDFWQACSCDELPGFLALAVFDAAVNQGESGARKMLQVALGVEVDGLIGDKTITAAFKFGPSIGHRFLAQRMARYIRIVMKDPTQEVFAENWSSRLMRCAELMFTVQKEDTNDGIH